VRLASESETGFAAGSLAVARDQTAPRSRPITTRQGHRVEPLVIDQQREKFTKVFHSRTVGRRSHPGPIN
jgi:hypothetical protein